MLTQKTGVKSQNSGGKTQESRRHELEEPKTFSIRHFPFVNFYFAIGEN